MDAPNIPVEPGEALPGRAGAERAQMQTPPRFSEVQQSVLVTGATGFIGQLLVRALLADGHEVTALTRSPRDAALTFGDRVRCIADLRELPATSRVDVMINLAGARILGARWSARRKQVLLRSRVALTQSLVGWIAAAHHKPRLLLSASAIGYYGIQARGDTRALAEDAPSQAIFMSTLCQEWEAAARGASAHGVHVCSMRFGLVLGAQGALPMMLLPVKFGLGGPLGSGAQWLSWIHVDDLLRGIAHLWQRSEIAEVTKAETETENVDGAWNFTAPEAVTQVRFSRAAAALLHRPAFMPTPALPMRLVLGEQADLLLEGQRVAPARLLASGFAFSYPTLEGALRNLLLPDTTTPAKPPAQNAAV